MVLVVGHSAFMVMYLQTSTFWAASQTGLTRKKKFLQGFRFTVSSCYGFYSSITLLSRLFRMGGSAVDHTSQGEERHQGRLAWAACMVTL